MHAHRSLAMPLVVVAALAAGAACAPLAAQSLVGAPAVTAGTVTGTFHIIWRDAKPGTLVRSDRRYALVDDRGRWFDVRIDAATLASMGGERALDRRRLTIDASRVLSPAEAGTPMPVLAARGVRLEQPRSASALETGFSAQAVTGSQPYLTILCRFSDTPTGSLAPVSRAQGIMGTSYPGMDNYYREVSNGQVNLAGSLVLPKWYDLPHPRSYYVVNNTADLGKLTDDCTGAADADVDFTHFHGINLQFSDQLDCCSWGGSWALNKDGQNRGYAMTWIAAWGLTSSTYGHEMGHSFGFPHSHGPYGKVYDSKWDIMSYAYNYRDPAWGNVGPHTIAFHKALVGWIPQSRRFAAPQGTSTILIERDAQPEANTNYLVAEIPIPGTQEHYTVEARRFVGSYDSHIPGEAIVIHRCGVDATVVDPDGNGDVNDAGAMWTPGETFTDAAAKISVTVQALVGNAYRVTIQNGATQVATDTPTLQQAAAELLGTPSLTASQKQLLDSEGNRDGTYNLGDFLAFANRSGQRPSGDLLARLAAGTGTREVKR